MLSRMLALTAALIFFAIPSAIAQSGGQGRWFRAESPNFIVYGDRSERQVRDAALALEDFDATLRRITGATAPPSQNKLEVFLLRGETELRQVRPGLPQGAGGFYLPGAELIGAFLIDGDVAGMGRRTVLFHEYAHHFMFHYFPLAYPRWYSEGWAEYVSTTVIRDGRAEVGAPSASRGEQLMYFGEVPMADFLAPERASDPQRRLSGSFYAQAWFATAYIMNQPQRRAGLARYVQALGDGADPIDAFAPAFGITPDQFATELRAFRRARVAVVGVPLPEARPEVSVSRLPPAADALLLPLSQMRLNQSETTPQLRETVTRAAARYPDDPLSRIAMARVALAQDDAALARSRLDAILAADETNIEARYLLATLLLREAAQADDHTPLVAEARRHFVRIFRQNPNHYPTLFRYAQTFSYVGVRMEDTNLEVLARALELAPQSPSIRLALARELMKAQMFDAAIATLRPLIYSPHNRRAGAMARALFEAAQQGAPPPNFDDTSTATDNEDEGED